MTATDAAKAGLLGKKVKLHGLQSARGQKLNGKEGVVLEGLNENGRYGVFVVGEDDVNRFKPENLEAISGAIKGVAIEDSNVLGASIELKPEDLRSERWVKCPVPHILGVPLYLKQVESSRSQPTLQVATRLMIEPSTGLAPPRWQGGANNNLGVVHVIRGDGVDFEWKDWAVLDDYIFNDIFGVHEEGGDPKELRRVQNAKAFAEYVAMRRSAD